VPETHIVRGKAAALRIDNLDTDQIMPKQFLRGIDKSGLASGLLYNLRFDAEGNPRPDFVLNRPDRAGTAILLGGTNFGCGSSREHAVWGLLQYGIRAVVAPSFGEIFHSNAMGNRLLLVQLPAPDVECLMALSELADPPDIAIDAGQGLLRCEGLQPLPFPISERHRRMFVAGLDVIGQTLALQADITRFSQLHWQRQPWLRDVAQRMKARLAAR
jgi:3-isopropylmalate/(R)-2-methylmalate dehydratase small subunit